MAFILYEEDFLKISHETMKRILEKINKSDPNHHHHHYHHHQNSSRQQAHKASTLSDQHLLSRATALASSQPLHPALFRSFSTVLLQVVFCLPHALRPSGVQNSRSHPIEASNVINVPKCNKGPKCDKFRSQM